MYLTTIEYTNILFLSDIERSDGRTTVVRETFSKLYIDITVPDSYEMVDTTPGRFTAHYVEVLRWGSIRRTPVTTMVEGVQSKEPLT